MAHWNRWFTVLNSMVIFYSDLLNYQMVTGWWFQTWMCFSMIYGIILPIDFHIFQRGWSHQPGKSTLTWFIYVYLRLLSWVFLVSIVGKLWSKLDPPMIRTAGYGSDVLGFFATPGQPGMLGENRSPLDSWGWFWTSGTPKFDGYPLVN